MKYFSAGIFLTLSVLIHVSVSISKFPNYYKPFRILSTHENEDNGEPLILTPYIEQGRIEEARELSEVNNEAFFNFKHYTGFFTVNKTHNSNLFTWFIPSESNPSIDPVLLWLQGGPGSSSLFGLFSENRPFKMKNEHDVILREERWTKNHSMIYIDNPAGTGYSFTGDINGYAHDETQVANELYEAILQFFILFPELKNNEFFITGESYGGHYIPAIAHRILLGNREVSQSSKINLKGLAIGNGWTDPINQLNYGEYLFQHGIVDSNTMKIMNYHRDKSIELVKQERYAEARDENDLILATFTNVTGYVNMYNYLNPFGTDDEPMLDIFIQRNDIRKAIHVGNLDLHNGDEVNRALNGDVMKSVVHLLPDLIDNYRVLLYSGQVDIIVAYPLTINYLEKLNFSYADVYKKASRDIWFVDDEIAGFVKVAGNLTDLLVRNAGHMVPTDQPKWALDLINRFTSNIPFSLPDSS